MGFQDPSSRYCPNCMLKKRCIGVTFRTKTLFLQWGHEMVVCSECGYVLTPQYYMTPKDKMQVRRQQKFKAMLELRLRRIKSRLTRSPSAIGWKT